MRATLSPSVWHKCVTAACVTLALVRLPCALRQAMEEMLGVNTTELWDSIAAAHHEVVDAVLGNVTEAWQRPGVLSGVRAFVAAVDWTEPFILALVGFHALLWLSALLYFRRGSARTIGFMGFLAVLVLTAEWANASCRAHWRLFTRGDVNYFDEGGLFVSALYSGPLLLLAFLLQFKLFFDVAGAMAQVHRAKARHQAEEAVEAKAAKGANAKKKKQ